MYWTWKRKLWMEGASRLAVVVSLWDDLGRPGRAGRVRDWMAESGGLDLGLLLYSHAFSPSRRLEPFQGTRPWTRENGVAQPAAQWPSFCRDDPCCARRGRRMGARGRVAGVGGYDAWRRRGLHVILPPLFWRHGRDDGHWLQSRERVFAMQTGWREDQQWRHVEDVGGRTGLRPVWKLGHHRRRFLSSGSLSFHLASESCTANWSGISSELKL
ncbi:hypothetical protein BS50DRAFT_240615 [Corynespora cassiicola Philippines]|uniref:Uncharacterized protein n=1 Tax=Corynespora cassiicola Philippines TaxID=1448308 RepID=A0A2T2P2U4_CORCC|nr:hypothetical protein BS50DRAFT_240615 [Corynespora cassiicola Philippines]